MRIVCTKLQHTTAALFLPLTWLDPWELNLHFTLLSHTCCINKCAWKWRGLPASLIRSIGPIWSQAFSVSVFVSFS
jgi:hypothetical protein